MECFNLLDDNGQRRYLVSLLKLFQIKPENAIAAFSEVYGVREDGDR